MKFKIIFCFLLASIALQAQHINELESLYSEGRYEDVVIQGKNILRSHPENLIANYLTGRASADLKKYGEALAYLQKTEGNKDAPDWMKAWSKAYLGICYFAIDKINLSEQYLKEAIKLNATLNSTSFAEQQIRLFQLTDYFKKWEIIETSHIRFHFQAGYKDINNSANSKIESKAYASTSSSSISSSATSKNDVGGNCSLSPTIIACLDL